MRWIRWMGSVSASCLLWACAREPDRERVDEPVAWEAPAPTPAQPPPLPPPSPSPGDAGTAPSPGDAGVPVDGPLTDALTPGAAPPACGTVTPTLLSASPEGTLIQASPRGRLLVFKREEGGLSVRDLVSGRLTHVETPWFVAFSPDERRVLLSDQPPFEEGRVLELEVATGALREPVPGMDISVDPEFISPRGTLTLRSRSLNKGWLYTLDSAGVTPLDAALRPSACDLSASRERVLVRMSGALVLWEVTSNKRWSLPPATSARMIPDGSAVVFFDAEQRAWGWTPERGPVLLGRTTAPNACWVPVANTHYSERTGTLLFMGAEQTAALWSTRTGEVRSLGAQVVSGVFSASGGRLLLERRLLESHYALFVQDLPSGAERMLWEGTKPSQMRLNHTGTRLAFTDHPEPEGMNPDNVYYRSQLWDVDAGKELAVFPSPGGFYYKSPSLSFRDEAALLHVSTQEHDSLHSADTGDLRLRTRYATSKGAGNFYSWGPGGVFYAATPGGTLDAPSSRLQAWDPRTGLETWVARSHRHVCELGERSLLRTGPSYAWDEDLTGPLTLWDAATRSARAVAFGATGAQCLPSRAAVSFFLEWRNEFRDENFQLIPGRGTLAYADLDRGCAQSLGEDVERRFPVDGGLVFQAKGQVWRVALP